MPPDPQAKQMILNGQVIENSWVRLVEGEDPSTVQNGASLLFHYNDYLKTHADYPQAGLWLPNTIDLASCITEAIVSSPVIAVEFPTFVDGRGFSIARLFRERFGFQGELRAVGYIIRDQLCYLTRCGFNAFELSDEEDLSTALASIKDFTEFYQSSVTQPQPLFVRRMS